MKILSLLWNFSPGGISKVAITYNRLNEFSDFEFKTTCIQVQGQYSDLEVLNKIGVEIISIKSKLDISWFPACKKIIDKFKPDILFVHGFNGPVIAFALKLKYKLGISIICSYHGLYLPPKANRRLLAPIFNKCMIYIYKNKADGIITVSEYSKKSLIKNKVPQNKIHFVHNGIPLIVTPEAKCNDKIRLNLNKNDVILGVVARLDPYKGLEYLLQAVSQIVKSNYHVKLIIIGDGDYKNYLQTLCRKLRIKKNISFVGFQKDIQQWLQQIDIFILPSLYENHSLSLLEAMYAGKPIIATSVGGNSESIRNGIDGLLIPPRNSKSIEKAIIRLISNPELRGNMAKSARKRFYDEFTEDIMVKKLAQTFRVINSSRF